MAPSATFKSLKQFFIFLILFMKRILRWFFSLETLRSLLFFIPNFMMIRLDGHAIFYFDLESHVPWWKRAVKSWLKTQHSENKDHGIRSHHFKANRNGETMETVTDFIILGSKITADGDCRHEIKRCLLLGRKAMTWRRKWQYFLLSYRKLQYSCLENPMEGGAW